ncbi:hypothetical protein HXX76_013609 [Chlamydomonas incerta]|uniref:Uncharacterized protein n=2 Tax=Chlamydomonas incerta TaxID=51695 RepID=A0A835SHC6_CHLIN|nr:hypothetical protein HXX76_013609 [Chlamydomonas incerta]|eukprot:KAG2425566.1 hypothetical protein HXX76_013609 [Chlamydomonas incerta]
MWDQSGALGGLSCQAVAGVAGVLSNCRGAAGAAAVAAAGDSCIARSPFSCYSYCGGISSGEVAACSVLPEPAGAAESGACAAVRHVLSGAEGTKGRGLLQQACGGQQRAPSQAVGAARARRRAIGMGARQMLLTALLAAVLCFLAPPLALAQTVNIASVTVLPDASSTATLTNTTDGYVILAAGAKPQLKITVSSSGGSSQYNVFIWYNYPFTGGNGPIAKGGLQTSKSTALITGGNDQTLAFSVYNETSLLDASGGLKPGCYVARVSLMVPGTSTFAGSPATAGMRVGNVSAAKCSDVVNIPPNCEPSLMTYNPSGIPQGPTTVTQPTTGTSCAWVTFTVPTGTPTTPAPCTDIEGTPLNYRWEAIRGNAPSTVYATKTGANVSFSAGLPNLDLPAGVWNFNLTVSDTPANASLTQSKVIQYFNVTVPSCPLNLAPTAPTLTVVGPCGGATMNVTAAATDPNADTKSYQFVLLSSTGSVLSTGAWGTAAWTAYSTTAAGGTLAAGRYTVQPRTSQPNATQPASSVTTAAEPRAAFTGASQPSTSQPAAALSGATQPSAFACAAQPCTPEPGTPVAASTQSASQPGAPQPAASQPAAFTAAPCSSVTRAPSRWHPFSPIPTSFAGAAQPRAAEPGAACAASALAGTAQPGAACSSHPAPSPAPPSPRPPSPPPSPPPSCTLCARLKLTPSTFTPAQLSSTAATLCDASQPFSDFLNDFLDSESIPASASFAPSGCAGISPTPATAAADGSGLYATVCGTLFLEADGAALAAGGSRLWEAWFEAVRNGAACWSAGIGSGFIGIPPEFVANASTSTSGFLTVTQAVDVPDSLASDPAALAALFPNAAAVTVEATRAEVPVEVTTAVQAQATMNAHLLGGGDSAAGVAGNLSAAAVNVVVGCNSAFLDAFKAELGYRAGLDAGVIANITCTGSDGVNASTTSTSASASSSSTSSSPSPAAASPSPSPSPSSSPTEAAAANASASAASPSPPPAAAAARRARLQQGQQQLAPPAPSPPAPSASRCNRTGNSMSLVVMLRVPKTNNDTAAPAPVTANGTSPAANSTMSANAAAVRDQLMQALELWEAEAAAGSGSSGGADGSPQPLQFCVPPASSLPPATSEVRVVTAVPLNQVGTSSLTSVCGANSFTSTTAFGGAGSSVACQIAAAATTSDAAGPAAESPAQQSRSATGLDAGLPNAATPPPSSASTSMVPIIAAAVGVGVVVAILGAIVLVVLLRRRKRRREEDGKDGSEGRQTRSRRAPEAHDGPAGGGGGDDDAPWLSGNQLLASSPGGGGGGTLAMLTPGGAGGGAAAAGSRPALNAADEHQLKAALSTALRHQQPMPQYHTATGAASSGPGSGIVSPPTAAGLIMSRRASAPNRVPPHDLSRHASHTSTDGGALGAERSARSIKLSVSGWDSPSGGGGMTAALTSPTGPAGGASRRDSHGSAYDNNLYDPEAGDIDATALPPAAAGAAASTSSLRGRLSRPGSFRASSFKNMAAALFGGRGNDIVPEVVTSAAAAQSASAIAAASGGGGFSMAGSSEGGGGASSPGGGLASPRGGAMLPSPYLGMPPPAMTAPAKAAVAGAAGGRANSTPVRGMRVSFANAGAADAGGLVAGDAASAAGGNRSFRKAKTSAPTAQSTVAEEDEALDAQEAAYAARAAAAFGASGAAGGAAAAAAAGGQTRSRSISGTRWLSMRVRSVATPPEPDGSAAGVSAAAASAGRGGGLPPRRATFHGQAAASIAPGLFGRSTGNGIAAGPGATATVDDDIELPGGSRGPSITQPKPRPAAARPGGRSAASRAPAWTEAMVAAGPGDAVGSAPGSPGLGAAAPAPAAAVWAAAGAAARGPGGSQWPDGLQRAGSGGLSYGGPSGPGSPGPLAARTASYGNHGGYMSDSGALVAGAGGGGGGGLSRTTSMKRSPLGNGRPGAARGPRTPPAAGN